MNKKGAEIPAVLFIVGVLALLILALMIVSSKSSENKKLVFSAGKIQDSYDQENTAKYGIDRSFSKAVETSYYEYANSGKWLSASCGNSNGYVNLCSISPTLEKDIQDSVKNNFIKNLDFIKDVNPIFFPVAQQILHPNTDLNKGIISKLEIGENAVIFASVSVGRGGVTKKFYMKSMLGTNLPYMYPIEGGYDIFWEDKPLIKIEKNLSLDLGLDSFRKILFSAVECKIKPVNEIESCMTGKLVNYDVKTENKDNKIFFDLTSKRTFSLGKINLKFYL